MLKFFRVPFASSGDRTAIPDAVDVNGNVSYAQGYGFDYQRQKTDPASKNIERAKQNALFFDLSNALGELQAQGVPDFITSALNGGTAFEYSANALVRYSGQMYVSLVDTNTALPTDATKWAPLPVPSRIQQAYYTTAAAGGTADAITAAFTPAISALPITSGTLLVSVRASAANTVSNPTFAPDGLTAKTIVKGNNLPLVPSDIAGAGHWLSLQYDVTLDKWVLLNPAKGVSTDSGLPAGTVIYAAQNTALSGTLKANGAAVSRTTYSALFAAIGTTFGAGDGSTTFNLPDLRAEFIRGWDDSRGVDSGRVFGSAQSDELKSHSHNISSSNTSSGAATYVLGAGPNASYNNSTRAAGGTETRPRNIALLACIKF